MDDAKHVFLDVTGDWCGPSVAMKPEWHALAKILEPFEDVVIASMDVDKNEKDPYYLPETFVPNLKLFKKACCLLPACLVLWRADGLGAQGEKKDPIRFPDDMERKTDQFLLFLRQQCDLDLKEHMEKEFEPYKKKHNVRVPFSLLAVFV